MVVDSQSDFRKLAFTESQPNRRDGFHISLQAVYSTIRRRFHNNPHTANTTNNTYDNHEEVVDVE